MSFTKYFALAAFLLAATYPDLTIAQKYGAREGKIDAAKIIKHCWDISEKARSSTSSVGWRVGHLDTTLCLEKAITEHASFLFDQPELSKEKLAKKFDDFHTILGRFYWDLYNTHKGCSNPTGCGTLYHYFHNAAMAKFYTTILTDIIDQRNQYKY